MQSQCICDQDQQVRHGNSNSRLAAKVADLQQKLTLERQRVAVLSNSASKKVGSSICQGLTMKDF